MQMLLTGDLISAEKALTYGLLNEVVPPDQLDIETMKMSEKIASKSRYGIQLGKQMFYEQLKCDDLEDAYELAGERMACNVQHNDARQGIDDFVYEEEQVVY